MPGLDLDQGREERFGLRVWPALVYDDGKLFATGLAEPTPQSVVNIDVLRFLPVLVLAHFIVLKKAPLSASECNDY